MTDRILMGARPWSAFIRAASPSFKLQTWPSPRQGTLVSLKFRRWHAHTPTRLTVRPKANPLLGSRCVHQNVNSILCRSVVAVATLVVSFVISRFEHVARGAADTVAKRCVAPGLRTPAFRSKLRALSRAASGYLETESIRRRSCFHDQSRFETAVPTSRTLNPAPADADPKARPNVMNRFSCMESGCDEWLGDRDGNAIVTV